MVNVLLIGYGKMGKVLEQVALTRGHQIAGKIDIGFTGDFPNADVAIEFTQPESAVDNIKKCIDQKIPVVSGTTGWLSKKDEVHHYCNERNGSLFYASNFSLGVNLFFHLNDQMARLMKGRPGYEVSIEEIHHTQKKDAPSGTAITLAEGIIRNYPDKTGWTTHENSSQQEIAIKSKRVDPVPGTHAVIYHSAVDDLEIRHTAHSREGFALGAVLVAEWLPGKKGALSMADFLKF
jgi:4-hydroxy-tetrahydrodipicolinate reductase